VAVVPEIGIAWPTPEVCDDEGEGGSRRSDAWYDSTWLIFFSSPNHTSAFCLSQVNAFHIMLHHLPLQHEVQLHAPLGPVMD